MHFNDKNFSKEEKEELLDYIEDSNDIYAFEKYCGVCMFFGDEESCPMYNKIHDRTKWEQIGCKKFFD